MEWTQETERYLMLQRDGFTGFADPSPWCTTGARSAATAQNSTLLQVRPPTVVLPSITSGYHHNKTHDFGYIEVREGEVILHLCKPEPKQLYGSPKVIGRGSNTCSVLCNSNLNGIDTPLKSRIVKQPTITDHQYFYYWSLFITAETKNIAYFIVAYHPHHIISKK